MQSVRLASVGSLPGGVVQCVDEGAQPTVSMSIEIESDAWKLNVIVRFNLGLGWGYRFDLSGYDDVCELGREFIEQRVRNTRLESEHENPIDEALGVVHAIEVHDLVDGFIDVRGDLEEIEIVR